MEEEIANILERFKSHENNSFQTIQALNNLFNSKVKPKGKEFSFVHKSVKMKSGEVAVWTDGLSLSSDTEPHCAYRLVKDKWYKVTVQEVPEPINKP